ncbi:hypothetical protein CNEO4_1590035 [Clostridium neonatale]|uniref:Uncharacterized protein n=1 Tax=Clostridium neonatale TaxID=137838 RepID=A0AAD1YGG0_9CLOT|nr:hypothetical protein CNEO2_1240012 [Clostridium neonatale]CAI3204628.1 hypothetical protein CNEO2_380002 [Clostridium neonatale]CAI3208027.1 hypothetical protein CNEO2_400055 [Clostridium neonatale]CAI3238905.1 hypothetical protein CNEO2_300002 [Clostridium neonatale]CAI3239222.1 hypothetical protein CNEO2_320002 [Clostridium neonatale]
MKISKTRLSLLINYNIIYLLLNLFIKLMIKNDIKEKYDGRKEGAVGVQIRIYIGSSRVSSRIR